MFSVICFSNEREILQFCICDETAAELQEIMPRKSRRGEDEPPYGEGEGGSHHDGSDEGESSIDIAEGDSRNANNLSVSPVKVVDQDFNSFINNGLLDISVTPSLDLSNSNITNLKSVKEKRYSVLRGMQDTPGGNSDLDSNAERGENKKEVNDNNKGGGNRDDGGNGCRLRIDKHAESGETETFEKEKNIYEHSPFCLEGKEETMDEVTKERVNDCQSYRLEDRLIDSRANELSISNDRLGSSMVSSIACKENELCFIKYLIVCNFKSYENENIIGPFSKFTAIIGPNGSGKSNIMDCICFVLGINNKYLRVKNLRSLIYHKENEKIDSISKRKCYVKLIVECNKENVEIKRTLNYRGVSNFFINDKQVEHKEYTTFLRKNRIETKTKTCLIFQGDIEEVINKKPTELAKLFEYISGSDEYEQIYEEVKEKLKEKQIACKNYLNEKKKIEQEIKVYKIQMNENIEHNKLKDDYENNIKMLYIFRLYHYLKKKEKFREDLLSFREEKIEFEQDVLSKNKKVASELEKKKLIKKKEFLQIEENIRNQNVQLKEFKIVLNEINERRKFCEESLNKIIANQKMQQNMQTHCSNFINTLNEQIDEQNRKLQNEYKNKLKISLKIFAKYEQIRQYLKRSHTPVYEFLMRKEKAENGKKGNHRGGEKDDIDPDELEEIQRCNLIELVENMEEYKKCKEQYLYLCANSNININNYSQVAASIRKDIKELQEECDNFSRKKQKEILELESEKLSLDELNGRVKKLNGLIEKDRKSIENSKHQLKVWNESITYKEKKIEQLDEEVNVLNVHKNELAFFEKRKEVIRNLKNIFGEEEIYDEVINLYEVTNQMYYTAVNNVIQKFNNFLLVKNVETCTKCIKYLKDNKLHKMDFIPLENFLASWKKKKKKKNKNKINSNEENNISYGVKNDERVGVNSPYGIIEKVINTFKKKNIVLANNCLVCEESYKTLFDYLVGEDTLIVDKIGDAEDIKKTFPQLNVNIITLNGHIVSKHNNLIIDITSKNVDRDTYNNRRLNINLYNKLLNEKDECRNSINSMKKKIIEMNEMYNKYTSDMELNKKKIASILIKKDIYEKEIEAKNIIIHTYEEKIEKIKKTDIKNKLDLLHNYENELVKERNSLASFQKESFQQLNEKLKIDNIYEIVEMNTREMEKINEHIDIIKNNINKINDDINELFDKKNEISLVNKKEKIENEDVVMKELNNMKEEEKNINDKMNEIHVILNELEFKKNTFHKDINQINQELNDLRESINNSFEKHEDIENQIENCQKRVQIYTQFIKDIINECDMNNVHIFSTTLTLGDTDHRGNNTMNSKGKMKGRRKSKLLEESGAETSGSDTRSESEECNNEEQIQQDDDDFMLPNISFDILPDELKKLESEKEIDEERDKMEKEIEKKKKFLKLRNVNSNAEKELSKLMTKLKLVDTSLANERKECNLFERNFRILQKKRSYKFLHCFNYIRNIIDNVYNNLTYNMRHHVGGQAFLDLCNYNEYNKDDEPFYCGIKYNNMPPMKRYFEITELSGGEKSISALALIFSIQKYINNSFIILDEVDANMDPLKINSLTRYLNSINSQVIVISLKDKFFSKSQTLIGVYKNKHKNCSKTVTLDIAKYRQDTPHRQ
ncbi:structural maintenance of chromosome protein, putative [Plasmodium ovale curtisi]|uniref:Structural maintenance of chromosome protein, putative n=1 Tax=Plasmodium ovale curtisi TaxID=864141 RepID=A0A1A8WJP3_PLAOA|nr:structural maintenance of chromosome protein, putative [Plasmodium ovale curtisi]